MEWIKNYVSYSQINSFYNYRKDFVNNYIYGIEPEPNDYMTFGKAFSEVLEDYCNKGSYTQISSNVTEVIDKIESHINIGNGTAEKRIECSLPYQTNCNEDPNVIGYIDWLSNGLIVDYKTGKKWTDNDLYQNKQLLIYAYWYYLQYGEIPKVAIINCPTTYYVGQKGLQLTGEVYYLEYKPTHEHIMDAMRWLTGGINDALAYIQANHSTQSGIDDSLIKLYINAKKKTDEWKAKADEYKAKLEQMFEEAKIDRYDSYKDALFYSNTRVAYQYSDKVKEAENALKMLKKAEEESGEAQVKSETKFWTFKPFK